MQNRKKKKEQTSVIKESCGGYKERKRSEEHLFPWAGERVNRFKNLFQKMIIRH